MYECAKACVEKRTLKANMLGNSSEVSGKFIEEELC